MGIVTQNYIKLVLNAKDFYFCNIWERSVERSKWWSQQIWTLIFIHYETRLTWIGLGVQAANSLGFQVLLLTIADPAWPNFGREMIKVKLAIFHSFFSMCFYSIWIFPKTEYIKKDERPVGALCCARRIWLVRKLS